MSTMFIASGTGAAGNANQGLKVSGISDTCSPSVDASSGPAAYLLCREAQQHVDLCTARHSAFPDMHI